MFILPTPENQSKLIKLRNMSIGAIIFITETSALLSSAIFFLKFVASDLESGLYAAAQIAALGCSSYTFVIALTKRHEIQFLLNEFCKIRNKCKCYLIAKISFHFLIVYIVNKHFRSIGTIDKVFF